MTPLDRWLFDPKVWLGASAGAFFGGLANDNKPMVCCGLLVLSGFLALGAALLHARR